jgi:hypothetical protein
VRLVTIHPFIDQGSHIAPFNELDSASKRLLIANIKGDLASRKAYYGALETAQADQSKSTFINLVLDQEIEALERYIKIIGG